jgi:hypothetical protein
VISVGSLLLLGACCGDPQDLLVAYPEGIVPGHSRLECLSFDPDSASVLFRYELPEGAQATAVLDQLRIQIGRSAFKRDVRPPIGCFVVLQQTESRLLMRCDDAEYHGPVAWDIRINGREVTVGTGPPEAVGVMMQSDPPHTVSPRTIRLP